MRKLLVVLVVLMSFSAQAMELDAKAYAVLHPETGTFILEKNADEQMPPASLTKMMTLYMLFSAIDDGVVSLDSQLPVSEKAWRKGGSKMFVEVGKNVAVEDLIKGIGVSSGNDACIVVAEFLAGSEEEFARQMNVKAGELGMANTHFSNASGWPDPEMHTTARDMAVLGWHLAADFPEYYQYLSLTEFEFSGIKQPNRNGLLRRNVGVDGIKTGHTEEAGYHLVSSAKRSGSRLVAAVLGTESMRAREDESLAALNYGFNSFRLVDVVQRGEIVQKSVAVKYGEPATVDVVAEQNLALYVNKTDAKVSKEVVLNGELVAPIADGARVGVLRVTSSAGVKEVPLIAARSVAELGWFGKIMVDIGDMF